MPVDLRSIFIANGTGVFVLLMLLYVSRARILRDTLEDRVYTAMVFGVMLGCCMEALSYAIDGQVFAGARILNYIANTYLFCANLMLSFCVLAYVDLGLYGDPKRIWKHYKPQIIIGAIMIAVNIVNFFVPVSYDITDQNVYERRPFGYVYYIVILYYLITALVLTKRYEGENGARAFFRVSLFIGPVLIGSGLQFAFYGLSLAWLSSALGLTGMYMMQQNELAYIDALVDTYNRQYLNHVLSAWISRGENFCGALLDIDGFKNINDNLGHTQGDAALRDFADALRRSRTEGEWVFRYAGDEFIVLKRADSPSGLDAYLDNLHGILDEYNRADRPYKLEASYGTSYFQGGDVDAFIREMDDNMYAMKKEHHRNTTEA